MPKQASDDDETLDDAAQGVSVTPDATADGAGDTGEIVARAKIDRSSFAPRTAALTQRALDIAQLAALDPTLCQRVSTELDRHAPWTRR